mgnify:CR=1 FL=1
MVHVNDKKCHGFSKMLHGQIFIFYSYFSILYGKYEADCELKPEIGPSRAMSALARNRKVDRRHQ